MNLHDRVGGRGRVLRCREPQRLGDPSGRNGPQREPTALTAAQHVAALGLGLRLGLGLGLGLGLRSGLELGLGLRLGLWLGLGLRLGLWLGSGLGLELG